jgi:hypothetical protein
MMSTSIWLSPVHQILNNLTSTFCILSSPPSFKMSDSSIANTTTGYLLQTRNWVINRAVSYFGSFLLKPTSIEQHGRVSLAQRGKL